MEVETISEQLLFTTAYIQSTFPRSQTASTGFIYLTTSNLGNHLFLVTNKHVVYDDGLGGFATQIKLKFITSGADGKPRLGDFTYINFDPFTKTDWFGHPDPKVDVAIIPLNFRMNALNVSGPNPYFKHLGRDLLFEVGMKPDLDALEEVVFVGYPNGLFDLANHLPLVRRGITASSVNIDFNGLPIFIIDAGVYPGSSGSPVFILDQGWVRDRKGNVAMGSRTILLGIISRTYHRTTQAAVEEATVSLTATVEEIIGLGIVVKARCIDETVQAYLKSMGQL